MLVTYLSDSAHSAAPFDPKGVPLVSKEAETEVKSIPSSSTFFFRSQYFHFRSPSSALAETSLSEEPMLAAKPATPEVKNEEAYARQFATIPELAHLGPLLKSSKPVSLTEQETEYVTSVVKHTFNDHVVLQYIIKNTLNDQLLERVSVTLDFDNEELDAEQIVPVKQLVFNQPESCFISLRKQAGTYPTATFSNTLKFIVKDCDPETFEPDEEGYDDEYAVSHLVTSKYW